MALEFNEQLSRLQKPDREEMTDEEYRLEEEKIQSLREENGLTENDCIKNTESLSKK